MFYLLNNTVDEFNQLKTRVESLYDSVNKMESKLDPLNKLSESLSQFSQRVEKIETELPQFAVLKTLQVFVFVFFFLIK